MRPKILLIDDDRPVLFLMTAVFKRADFDVVAVTSARDAIARLESEVFQLVVTDFFLGEETGADVVLAVRQLQPALKVIVVTGDVGKLPEGFGCSAGVFRVIPKPFQVAELLHAAKDSMGLMMSRTGHGIGGG